MTKQASDETALRCHMILEEANKVSPSVTEAIVKNALAICSTHVDPEQEGKPKRTEIKIKMNSFRSRLGRIMQRLLDLESCNEPEKPLQIDFEVDLYQMEHF